MLWLIVVWFDLPGVALTLFSNCKSANFSANMKVRHISSVKIVAIQPNALTFLSFYAAAPSLIYSKDLGGRTVAAAVSVAANKVVAEPTNVSFAIFVVFDMQNMQLMIKHTHIMAIPTAHPLPKFNRWYAEVEGRMWQ